MCVHDDYYDRDDSDVEEFDARMFSGDTPGLDDVGHTDDGFHAIKFIGVAAGLDGVDDFDDNNDEEFNDGRFQLPRRKHITFSVPIEKQENRKIQKCKIRFINIARFVTSSL